VKYEKALKIAGLKRYAVAASAGAAAADEDQGGCGNLVHLSDFRVMMNDTTQKTACPWLLKAVDFLNDVGLPTRIVDEVSGFLPHIRITQGELECTLLADVSDLLHEAGHLATIPEQFRAYMDGDVGKGQKRMFEEVGKDVRDPDGPLYRAMIQCSDPEATAWGWAAGEHLQIPKELRVLDHHFEDGGADQRMGLEMGYHFGINGLAHAGFCVTRPALAERMGRPAYPKLKYWIHPVINQD